MNLIRITKKYATPGFPSVAYVTEGDLALWLSRNWKEDGERVVVSLAVGAPSAPPAVEADEKKADAIKPAEAPIRRFGSFKKSER